MPFNLPNRKIRVTLVDNVINPFDITLEALQNVQDAINEIKVRKNIITEKERLQDYDKIIKHLEDSMSNMLNAVVIFHKYEKAL